jgi:hypothetical protein
VFSRKVTRLDMPDDVDAGRPPLRLEREPAQDHVAAVGAAVEGRAVLVEVVGRGEPVVQRGEVGDGVHPQPPVVEAAGSACRSPVEPRTFGATTANPARRGTG